MTKILILGGGFGGIRAALDLEKKLNPAFSRKGGAGDKAEITLVDKKSYHLFVPALYEVASAYGVKRDPFAVRLKKTICIPYSDIFKDKKINFVQAEITSIDLKNKEVATGGGEVLDYDYLVIALGSQTADLGIPGAKEYAFQFKNLEDALILNNKLEELVSSVQREGPDRKAIEDPRQSRDNIGLPAQAGTGAIKIAIVGAGFTGIELAAEFACCVKKLAKACGIKGRCERIVLLEAGPKILPAVSEDERSYVLRRLTRLGIEVMEGAAAEEVGGDYVKLKNGKQIETDLVVWTAGIRLPDLLEKIYTLSLTENPDDEMSGPRQSSPRMGDAPLREPKRRGKKIKVNNGLELIGSPGVFAVGDNTEFVDPKTSKPVPALAYVAVDQGKIAAKNILRSMNNKNPVEYEPFYGVWIAPVGGKYALAHLWGLKVKGFWGWVLRELVDFKYMLSILPFKKALSLMWQEMTLFTKND